jgi:hypothetical protein
LKPLAGAAVVLLIAACHQNETSADAAVVAVVEASAPMMVDAAEEPTIVVDASDEDADVEHMSEKGMRVLDEIATLVEANKRDCDALGARLEAYYEEEGQFVLAAKAAFAKLAPPEKKALQTRYRTRFNATWKRIQPGMKACKDNASVKTVLDKVL